MKKYLIYTSLIIFSICVFFSCGKQLNLSPPDQGPTADAIIDMNGLTTATQGMYQGMRNINYYGKAYLVMPELMGDNVYLAVDNSNRYLSTYRFNWVTGDADVTGIWNTIYRDILWANNIINSAVNISTISSEEETEKNDMIGQAYFLRALEHFDLVRFFGKPFIDGNGAQLGVPYITNGEIGTPSRNTVGEVYNFVIADLKKARTLMSGDNSSPYYANSDAVAALLSRVYLYRGNNDSAVIEASKVIAGNYSIFDAVDPASYADFFNTPGTSEDIFTLRYLANETSGADNFGNMYLKSGYGDVRVSPGFASLFDNNDARKNAFIIPYPDDPKKPIHAGEFENIKFSGQDATPGLYSPKILRISEIYLNRAEAYAKLKNYTDAIKDVNAIRTKRGLDKLTGVADAAVLDTVLNERRKELMFEGNRYFDLMRNGKDINRTDCDNPHVLGSSPCSIKYNSNNAIVPIPQRERDANPNMEQNPGYDPGTK